MRPSGRRLTLSPIGFDIVLALSQAVEGLRLADLAHVIGSPVSSVQTALRILVANELVRREAVEPPRYRLAPAHPARDELASLATVLPEPAHAIGIILRANPSVAFAAVDSAGFIVAERAEAPEGAGEALGRHLDLVAGARPGSPGLLRMSEDEFDRLVRVQLELRARARKALAIKGRPPSHVVPSPAELSRRRAAG